MLTLEPRQEILLKFLLPITSSRELVQTRNCSHRVSTASISYPTVIFSLVLVTVPLAAGIGLALGIWSTRNKTVERTLNTLFDVMQATPHMAYLGPVVVLFGFGQVPAMLATLIFALSLCVMYGIIVV